MGEYAILASDYKLDFTDGIIYENDTVYATLNSTELKILRILASEPHKKFKKDTISEILDSQNTPIADIAGAVSRLRALFSDTPLSGCIAKYGYTYYGGKIINSESNPLSHIISYEETEYFSENQKRLMQIKEKIENNENILLIAIEAEKDSVTFLKYINDVLRDAESSRDVEYTAYGIHISDKAEAAVHSIFRDKILNISDYYVCIFNQTIEKKTCSKILEWRKKKAPISLFFCERDLYSSNMFSSTKTDIEIDNLKTRYNDPRRNNEYTSCDTFYSDDIRTFFFKRLRELYVQKARKQLQKKNQKKNRYLDRADFKFRPTSDSDIVSRSNSDRLLIESLGKHRSSVSKSVLCKIFNEEHSDEVWQKISEIIPYDNESVYIRQALECLADYQQFRHPTFLPLAKSLSEKNQNEYALFLGYLKRISYDECLSLYNKGYGNNDNVNIKNFHKMLIEEAKYNPEVE